MKIANLEDLPKFVMDMTKQIPEYNADNRDNPIYQVSIRFGDSVFNYRSDEFFEDHDESCFE